MEWVNLHTSTLDSPEVIGADPKERATWLFLLRYCCGQENGGMIRECARWGDRKWQQLVRVTRREVGIECGLWKWEGDDLRVNFYPTRRQQEIEAKRKAGRDTVAKRWGKQCSSTDGSPNSSAIRSADTEGEREGEVEREGELSTARGGLPDSLNTPQFREHWLRWQTYWSEQFNYGKPMPEMTAHQQLRDCSEMGGIPAIQAINNAIAKGNLRRPALPFSAIQTPQTAAPPPRKVLSADEIEALTIVKHGPLA